VQGLDTAQVKLDARGEGVWAVLHDLLRRLTERRHERVQTTYIAAQPGGNGGDGRGVGGGGDGVGGDDLARGASRGDSVSDDGGVRMGPRAGGLDLGLEEVRPDGGESDGAELEEEPAGVDVAPEVVSSTVSRQVDLSRGDARDGEDGGGGGWGSINNSNVIVTNDTGGGLSATSSASESRSGENGRGIGRHEKLKGSKVDP